MEQFLKMLTELPALQPYLLHLVRMQYSDELQ